MKIYFIATLLIAFLFLALPAFANEEIIQQLVLLSDSNADEVIANRKKVTILEKFLEKQKSPLTPYAVIFVEQANKNNLDYRLVVAITGVESAFGRVIPANSFNAYGWNNGEHSFESWEKGIERVSTVLNEKYRLIWGAETPHEIGKYYATSPTWSVRVENYMNQINDSILLDTDTLIVNL